MKLRDGRALRGALKSETKFDAQLMGLDGHLYLLSKEQIADITHESASLMPKVQATASQMRDLVAYLSQLKGDAEGLMGDAQGSVPLPPLDLGPGVSFADVIHPKDGEWPSYNGSIGGNRFSPLTEVQHRQRVKACSTLDVHPPRHSSHARRHTAGRRRHHVCDRLQ